jgi:hypothetical protein
MSLTAVDGAGNRIGFGADSTRYRSVPMGALSFREGGEIEALLPGDIRVIATVGAFADSATLTVTAPAPVQTPPPVVSSPPPTAALPSSADLERAVLPFFNALAAKNVSLNPHFRNPASATAIRSWANNWSNFTMSAPTGIAWTGLGAQAQVFEFDLRLRWRRGNGQCRMGTAKIHARMTGGRLEIESATPPGSDNTCSG